MKFRPDTVSIQSYSTNTAASGANSVVTLNAVSGGYNVIDWIVWSYNTTPAANSTIVIVDGSTTIVNSYVTTDGPGQLCFGERGLTGSLNTAMTITLLDGTAAKTLTVAYR